MKKVQVLMCDDQVHCVRFGPPNEKFSARDLENADVGEMELPDSLYSALIKGIAFIVYDEGDQPPFPGAIHIGESLHWLCEAVPPDYKNPWEEEPNEARWKKWGDL